MIDLLTITLNPSLDLSADSGAVVPGPKLRLAEPVAEAGGGGINVARAAVILGGHVRAVAALGGLTGERVAGLLEDSGVAVAVFHLDGETRQSLVVTDRTSGAQYRFVMPGPQWTGEQPAELLLRLTDDVRRMGPGALVVLSGSQPPGVPDSFPTDLVQTLPQARVIVDTSGPALTRLVQHPVAGGMPAVLRMDHKESEDLAGRLLPQARDSLDFAQELVARGVAGVVVLALGAEGSVLATATERLHCAPPRVPVVSKTGAGDSFMGGFTLALARGDPWPEALRLGTAAAAAAVMTPGSALCRAEDVMRLRKTCQLRADL